MSDYLGMPIKPVIDEQGNTMKVDQIASWQDHSTRSLDLVSLALTMAAIPASSAASERLFSISGWYWADRKDRLDRQHLAAKAFLSCNKDLMRANLFNKSSEPSQNQSQACSK
ncbi:Uncharacterized protein APZ42_005817 [Daphnia magna]|uniref:HAT C-terminal dimerisation domain-containing protein n=1 Tax=Daphnia magna TaxID=35525 RepID=A0A162BXF9_9CRUS|nr:Uncharacterized protein APZ42_005817 [Daphnia magna]